MIAVEKDLARVPHGLKTHDEQGKSRAIVKKIQRFLDEGPTANIDTNLYQSAKKDLMGLYHNKCAYCESALRKRGLQVEHYRPKNGGYYWLAYEWSNLTLACADCNGGKGAKFPIAGPRLTAPDTPVNWRWDTGKGVYRDEQPLILNPEFDEPDQHLEFLPDGHIRSKNHSQRGSTTISTCDLDCDELVLWRLKALRIIRDQLNNIVEGLLKTHKKNPFEKEAFLSFLDELCTPVFHKLRQFTSATEEYAGLFRQSEQEFGRFFTTTANGDKPLAKQPRLMIEKAYLRFLERNP